MTFKDESINSLNYLIDNKKKSLSQKIDIKEKFQDMKIKLKNEKLDKIIIIINLIISSYSNIIKSKYRLKELFLKYQ
jgi:hypothetical protein